VKLTLLAAAALAAGAWTMPANAAAVGFAKGVAAGTADPIVEKVHFRHRSCQLGVGGWHYHVRGDRRSCFRRPGIRFWTWRCEGPRCDWYHSRDRRWRR